MCGIKASILNNAAVANMLTRRSVRKFQESQIRDDELKTLLVCGLYAPNGANLQQCRLIVIQKSEIMDELNAVIREELSSRELVEGQVMNKGISRARQPGYHFIYHAPTLITAVAPGYHSNSMADCAVCLENIQLAASSLGLGACWSNQPHWLTDVPAVRRVFERLGMREDEDIFGSVAVGYPDYVAKEAVRRKDGRVMLDR